VRPLVNQAPFDAVLVVAFGGPEGIDDIRPFLANVLRGRRVPAERVEAVARHYELFGGKSPLTEITRRQADGLRARLSAVGIDLPVYIGMRNWHPLLPDTLRAKGNRLEIEVTNLMANRLTDLDRRKVPWRNFFFVNIEYKPFDASKWEPLPSGLLGPVQLVPLRRREDL